MAFLLATNKQQQRTNPFLEIALFGGRFLIGVVGLGFVWGEKISRISDFYELAINATICQIFARQILKIRFHCEFKLIDKDGFECRDIVLLIEQQHCLLVFNRINSPE